MRCTTLYLPRVATFTKYQTWQSHSQRTCKMACGQMKVLVGYGSQTGCAQSIAEVKNFLFTNASNKNASKPTEEIQFMQRVFNDIQNLKLSCVLEPLNTYKKKVDRNRLREWSWHLQICRWMLAPLIRGWWNIYMKLIACIILHVVTFACCYRWMNSRRSATWSLYALPLAWATLRITAGGMCNADNLHAQFWPRYYQIKFI